MKGFLSNPFNYIYGWKAMLAGICSILLIAWLGTYTHMHMDGPLDIHYEGSTSFSTLLIENGVNVVSLILVYGIILLIIKRVHFRLIDLAGIMAFTRLILIPVPLLALFLDPRPFMNFFLHRMFGMGKTVELSTGDVISFILLSFVTIVLIIWSVYWIYKGFKNLAGGSNLLMRILFLVGVIIAELLAKILLYALGIDQSILLT
ncbi:MAG: hypothetical protein K9I94_05280 [Bacteroidales bacterium]|nr:hypothetical protein [Bacteroidales bacterium]